MERTHSLRRTDPAPCDEGASERPRRWQSGEKTAGGGLGTVPRPPPGAGPSPTGTAGYTGTARIS